MRKLKRGVKEKYFRKGSAWREGEANSVVLIILIIIKGGNKLMNS